MATIRSMSRPRHWDWEIGEAVPVDFLRVVVCLVGDGSYPVVLALPETISGLMAEWEAGTSTTILVAAITDAIDGLEIAGLSPAQRALIGDDTVFIEEL